MTHKRHFGYRLSASINFRWPINPLLLDRSPSFPLQARLPSNVSGHERLDRLLEQHILAGEHPLRNLSSIHRPQTQTQLENLRPDHYSIRPTHYILLYELVALVFRP